MEYHVIKTLFMVVPGFLLYNNTSLNPTRTLLALKNKELTVK